MSYDALSLMKLICILIFFNICALASADDASKLRSISWKEISQKEGIKVYQAQNYSHDTRLVPIRFEAIVDFDISRVLTVLADNKRKTEWLPRGKVATLLEQKSSENFVVYYKYDLPWPIKDRDFIIQNIGRIAEGSNVVSVDMYSIEHPSDPNKKDPDAIRGKTWDAYSIIKPIGDNKTFIEMAILTDFKGLVPVWLINMIQKKWPYRFMKNLRNQLAKKDIVINPAYKLKKTR